MPEIPSNFPNFDAKAAAEALGAEPRALRDVAHGKGEAIDVGETTVEVYRDAGVARVTTPDARIELFRVPNYTVTGERVVFEQGTDDDRSRLLVRGDGKVSFYPVLRAAESSRTRETVSGRRQDSPAGHVLSETATTSDSAAEGENSGEAEQIQLQGRLGRDPWFRLDGEQKVAGFPLAVNTENETTWHKVVLFDAAADKLHEDHGKGHVRRGRLVAVTGQTVVREGPKPNGGVRKSAEFHATAVTRVQTTRPQLRR